MHQLPPTRITKKKRTNHGINKGDDFFPWFFTLYLRTVLDIQINGLRVERNRQQTLSKEDRATN